MRALLALLPLALALPDAPPINEAVPGPPPTTEALPAPSTAPAEPTAEPPAAAAPALVPRADPTAIWVGVNKDGSPTATVTPHQTLVNGHLTLADAPPYELTGTVFTSLQHMRKTTSTGSRRPQPTAKGKTGAFAKCFKDGEESPFCEPVSGGNVMVVGRTYYVTWDPKFFKDEAAVAKDPIQISLEAHRLGDSQELGDKRWETKDRIPSRYGVYGWKPPKNVLHGREPANVTLILRTHYKDSDDEDAQLVSTEYVGPTVLVENKQNAPYKGITQPENQELYVALPIITIAVLIVVLGGFLYNRNLRKIGYGNVMSRKRHGYGLRKSRKKMFGKGTRMGARSEEMANMLDDFDGRPSEETLPVLREEMERSEQEWNKRKF